MITSKTHIAENVSSFNLAKKRKFHMFQTTIPRVVDIYKTLMNFNGQQLNPNEKSCNMQTALFMIAECEKLIKNKEQLEMIKMNKMHIELRNFLHSITNYISFDCNCHNTMRFINLHAKARDGLANKLPELEKDVEIVTWQVQTTMAAIIKSHEQPKNIFLNIEKKVQMLKLIDLFNVNKVKYENFERRFDRLYNYLKNKLNNTRSPLQHVHQAVKYLEGKSDVFLSFLEEEDNDFINIFFGDSTEDAQNVLRNSLKEVMAKRGVSLPKAEEIQVELTDEQKTLLDSLDTFYNDLLNVKRGVKIFQNLVLSSNLQDLQTYDVILIDLKKEIDNVLN